MPEDQEQQEKEQQERAPAWLNQLREELGGAFQHIDQRLARAEQAGQRPTAPPPPAQPGLNPNQFRERIHQAIINEPERYTAEVVGTAVQQARQVFEQQLEQERAQNRLSQARDQFWGQFYSQPQNATLSGFHAQVEENLRRMGIDPNDALYRGDYQGLWRAADQSMGYIRQYLDQMRATEAEMEKRQKMDRRLLAGTPGGQLGGPGGEIREEDMKDVAERTADALAERRALKLQRGGVALRNDPDYHEQQRMRGNVRRRTA